MVIKRLFDLLVSLGLCLVLALPLFIIAVIARIKIGSPVIFRQVRPGRHGKPFVLLKFRTMTDERDADGKLLGDAQRLLPFGRFLRKTSLDELPEIWNVLKGEMSLVGPRPMLMEYLPLYNSDQARRHNMPPGITGWAQVNGRNTITWDKKFEYDIWYIDNRTFLLDLVIILKTFIIVLRREGIAAGNDETTPPFRGS